MRSMIDAAVSRSRTTLLLMFMVVLAGMIARFAIPIENDPDIAVPFYVVTLPHEGISPEDAERLLVLPTERELRTVEGVEEITAYAAEGAGTIVVEFDANYDLDQALTDVREAVDRAKPELPSTAEEPIILEESTSDFPIIQVNLVGEDVPERVLFNLASAISEDLEGLASVLEAPLRGEREEMLEAVIDPVQLEHYEISNEQLINTIVRNNRLIPAGALDTGAGRFSVKIPSVIEEARDVFDLPLKATDETVVTLKDVASIRRTFKDRQGYARINGRSGISIEVIKRGNANIIDTIGEVKAIVEGYRDKLPRQVDLFYSQDQSPFAMQQVSELQGNIFTALALVMVLVVAAMGLRSGIIVGLGIPVSFLFALTWLYLIGYTFNFMVMFGMLLGLGMLIDGAIVITEYADRKMTEGFDRRSAYSLAAKRMFWPVTASIATTLAAFLPLMFWPGVSGKFMRFLPVTVFTVLSGSLIYALLFGPTIGALIGRAGARDEKAQRTLNTLEEGDPTELNSPTGWYARLVQWSCRHASVTLTIAAAVIYSSFWLYGEYGRGMTFFSDSDPQYAQVTVRARGNLSAEEVRGLVEEVETEILDIPGIEFLNTYTTVNSGDTRSGFDKIGSMFLAMYPEGERTLKGREIMEEIRVRTAHLAGVGVEVQGMEQGPPVGKDVVLAFQSAPEDRALLEPAVTRVRAYIDAEMPELRDITDTRSLPGIEWKLTVDRAQAALYGADVSLVGIAVQLVTNGVKVGEYRPDDAEDEVDIRVRFPFADRGIAALDDLKVTTNQGLVPISNFVKREPVQRTDTIERLDGKTVEYLRADMIPGALADDAVQQLSAWLETQSFDPRMTIAFKGSNEEQNDAMAFVGVAFGMSLLLMFVLLVTQFNSFYQATLILVAVVMSTAGVLLGLVITQQPFSAILTGVGVVALAGIVVNNNIVLIDTYNHLRKEHPELDYVALIVRTGAQRLRPVMLTTVTTVFGLLPLASNLSIDFISREIVYGGQLSMFWVPLSQAIVSGLTFATLLTLITTPAMLALPHELQRWLRPLLVALRRYWRRLKSRLSDPGVDSATYNSASTPNR